MRISTNQIFYASTANMASSTSNIVKTQHQLTSGERFQLASEDPTGFAKTNRLSEVIEANKQYIKNSTLVTGGLSVEESTLDKIQRAIDRARVLAIAVNNGTLSAQERASTATEVEGLQSEIYDLMNARNASGDFIFSGSQSGTQAFAKNPATGRYEFQGDGVTNQIQISPSVFVQQGDSGLDIFEKVPARYTANGVPSAGSITVEITAQEQFDNYHKGSYDFANPSASRLNIVTTAGTPDTFIIQDAAGVPLSPAVGGNYVPGEAISFAGMKITMNGAAGTTAQINLDPPRNENVLNHLEDFKNALLNPTIVQADLQPILKDVSVGFKNTADSVLGVIGQIGSRINTMKRVEASNTSFDILNQEARAGLSETDYAEASAKLAQQEMAMQVAYSTFNKVTSLSLFDYV
ncbi:flagellar hook-associated protein FlgL [Motilimonas cestriensis]|uniref:Flagellar hook-associated protein FlgL n=1 Tax=Motilimonas cestriensis TaxID=2742685 RepID=A0ABS8WD97_9GAMM|nr:flagellar hook-associated protein FlgL [Motilimonas cestriensis]MCE2595601.1 flagellar hook-associated protein FlgL [Motilimonas cestriensis]